MVLKQRKVRSSQKFKSRLRSTSRQRREYATSVLSTAVVQGLLAVSLWIAAVRAYQAVSAQTNDVSMVLELAMPVAFTLGGLWCLRLCVKNLRSGRSMWIMSRRSPPSPE